MDVARITRRGFSIAAGALPMTALLPRPLSAAVALPGRLDGVALTLVDFAAAPAADPSWREAAARLGDQIAAHWSGPVRRARAEAPAPSAPSLSGRLLDLQVHTAPASGTLAAHVAITLAVGSRRSWCDLMVTEQLAGHEDRHRALDAALRRMAANAGGWLLGELSPVGSSAI
jgi:hypothetical protein